MKKTIFNYAGLGILLSAALFTGLFSACSTDDPIDSGKQIIVDEPGEPVEPGEPGEPSEPSEPEEPWLSGTPELLINELRTAYSGNQNRAEFIELKVKSAGNMEGIKVYVASNTKEPLVYQFNALNVYEGEYLVLHLRTSDDSCVDEYGKDLDASGGWDACATARDFWVPGNNKLLRNTDVVIVMDNDDQILDSVMLAETTITALSPALSDAAILLFMRGEWMTPEGTVCDSQDAVITEKTAGAYTRSICRDETAEDTNTAADWYATVTNGATPGKENDTRRM